MNFKIIDMTTKARQSKAEKTIVFNAENHKVYETSQKTAAFLEEVLKHYNFGYYVKTAQSRFKKNLIEDSTRKVDMVLNHFTMGLITNSEKDNLIAGIWLHANCCLYHFIVYDSYRDAGPYHYKSKAQRKEFKKPVSKSYIMADRL
jgi:hypothetical protein